MPRSPAASAAADRRSAWTVLGNGAVAGGEEAHGGEPTTEGTIDRRDADGHDGSVVERVTMSYIRSSSAAGWARGRTDSNCMTGAARHPRASSGAVAGRRRDARARPPMGAVRDPGLPIRRPSRRRVSWPACTAVPATDYALVHEGGVAGGRQRHRPGPASSSTVRSGALRIAYRLSDGRVGDARLLRRSRRRPRSPRPPPRRSRQGGPAAARRGCRGPHRDRDPARRRSGSTLMSSRPRRAVRARHPEVTWLAGRPMATTLDRSARLRGELWAARRDAYAAAADAFRAEVEAAGGSIGYVSTSAPLVFLDVPAHRRGRAGAASRRPEPRARGRLGEPDVERRRHGRAPTGPPAPATRATAHGSRWSSITTSTTPATWPGRWSVRTARPARSPTAPGRATTRPGSPAPSPRRARIAGVAPGATSCRASTGGYSAEPHHRPRIIAAADWSVAASGGDADIVNASIGQDTATGAEEARRYFDSIGWEDGRLVVAAAGNFSDVRQLGRRVTGDGLQRPHRRRRRRPQHRRLGRRPALVRPGLGRRELSRSDRRERGTSTATTTSRTSPRRR